jgi:hydroxyquinol 1,2-dioxygenase
LDGTAADPGTTLLTALTARVDGHTPAARSVLQAIAHLHALVAETGATAADLQAVIGFLTDVGHATDAQRQEWVLLADVIGVSTLIEDQSHIRPPGATPNTVAGPFYRADVPDMADGADICRDGKGQPMAVALILRDLAGRAVQGAAVEVWQANGDGLYENQTPDLIPEHNLRGRFRSGADGAVRFRSVRPGGYILPSDGPVGRLMAMLGCAMTRPAHMHVRVTAPGYQTLTTHLFDAADPAVGQDALFGVKPGLLARIAGDAAGWRLDHVLVLADA